MRFPVARLHAGYRADEVDTLLDRIQAALASWERGVPAPLRSSDLHPTEGPGPEQLSASPGTVGLTVTRFGARYDVDAVDDLIDRAQQQLHNYEVG